MILMPLTDSAAGREYPLPKSQDNSEENFHMVTNQSKEANPIDSYIHTSNANAHLICHVLHAQFSERCATEAASMSNYSTSTPSNNPMRMAETGQD